MQFAISEIELPVRLRFERLLTDDELLRFCERQEILHVEREPDGTLDVRPIGGTSAGATAADLIAALWKWNQDSGRGEVFSNCGFILPDGSMRGPRLAWVSNERWNALAPELRKRFPSICPEFVIEILSFNYTLAGLQQKMREWIANGAELAWLIDPERKAVEIYRPGQEPEVLEGTSAVYGEGPVGGFVLELARLWS
jgi:Uma2 family endonuclease